MYFSSGYNIRAMGDVYFSSSYNIRDMGDVYFSSSYNIRDMGDVYFSSSAIVFRIMDAGMCISPAASVLESWMYGDVCFSSG